MVHRPFESLDSLMADFRQAVAAAEQRAMTEIEEFKNALDDEGNLLHPHFDAVEDVMGQLAQLALEVNKPVPALDDLYETAISLMLEMATAIKH